MRIHLRVSATVLAHLERAEFWNATGVTLSQINRRTSPPDHVANYFTRNETTRHMSIFGFRLSGDQGQEVSVTDTDLYSDEFAEHDTWMTAQHDVNADFEMLTHTKRMFNHVIQQDVFFRYVAVESVDVWFRSQE